MSRSSFPAQEFQALVLEVVAQIPPGQVATYGQVARYAGFKGYARHVGKVLAASNDSQLPWHRVVNAKGEISPRPHTGSEALQRQRLEAEGVEFGLHGRIVMRQHAWQA